MAQGKVVKTPMLSTVRPVAPFKEMPTMGLSPDTSFTPDPSIPATMFAMPPDGSNPFQLDVAPPPMDFSNVSGNGNFGGVLPDGIFSPAELLRRRQEAEDKIQKAVLKPYLDLSQIPMEQMLPVPEELPYTSEKPALAAAGIMGLVGGDFGARAGANAAARFTQAADAVRKEREARDFARTQLQNELIQQRNQMALKKGDLQNDDIARYNQEQLRRESSERDLLERRFANEAKAYERQLIEQNRRDALKEKMDLEKEKLELKRKDQEIVKARDEAKRLYMVVKPLIDKVGYLTVAERKQLQQLQGQMLDPKLRALVPELGDISAEAKRRLENQEERTKIARQARESHDWYWRETIKNQQDAIKSRESIARDSRALKERLANTPGASSSAAIKGFQYRSSLASNKIKEAEGYMRQVLQINKDVAQLRKQPGGFGLDDTYIDPRDQRLNGFGDTLRGNAAAMLSKADELERKAMRLFDEGHADNAQIERDFYDYQGRTGSPVPAGGSGGGQGGGPASNVRKGGKGDPRVVPFPVEKPTGSASDYLDPQKALGNLERGIAEAENRQKNRKK